MQTISLFSNSELDMDEHDLETPPKVEFMLTMFNNSIQMTKARVL